MKNRNWNRFAVTTARLLLLISVVAACTALKAQAPTRFVGTVTAISGTTITVKTDAGDSKQVEVPATAVMKRLAPGQKDLSAAETIHLTDLATGDRVLVKLDPDATGDDASGAASGGDEADRYCAEAATGARGVAAERHRRIGEER